MCVYNAVCVCPQLLSERSGVEPWVCVNVSQLLKEENTVPFMVRYRKDLINHLDADAVRDIQLALEEIRWVAGCLVCVRVCVCVCACVFI